MENAEAATIKNDIHAVTTDAGRVCFSLPPWLTEMELKIKASSLTTDTDKMNWVLKLAHRNIADGGGPFAAAIFALDTGKLVAPGVNRVVALNCSVLHAEMLAIMLAQQRLDNYSLNPESGPGYELVTSTEPCAMCLGAIPWAGLKRLVCGARDQDARAVGFDEGDKPEHWVNSLERRGIKVTRDICRTEAAKLLQEYSRTNGEIYNGG
ncbi:MAG: nucleoside deaminase [Desulfuromonadaceae bacterium]|nr:nucleoside deaminase [Desulfuromonadaceae bacterium]